MNSFSIIFLVLLAILCVVELVSLIRAILVKKKNKESLKQANADFQKLAEDNTNKEE